MNWPIASVLFSLLFLIGTSTAQEERAGCLGSPAIGVDFIDDPSSIPNHFAQCCSNTFRCHVKGGRCLPSWLKRFLSCYNDDLCDGDHCSCFFKPNICQVCTIPCPKGTVCRPHGCLKTDLASSVKRCGKASHCNCCHPRPSKDCDDNARCFGGTCKERCDEDEVEGGICLPNGGKCKCCKPNQAPCSGKCGDNGRGKCALKKYCPKPFAQMSGYCPGEDCVCCKYIILPQDPILE